MSDTLPIDQVRVDGRHRQDLGDLDGFAKSISTVGLLHPVVVTESGDLIAGQRRLEACRLVGWDEVPVTVAGDLHDVGDLLAAERDENTCRLDMTPSEKVALGRTLEELERPKAAARMGNHGAAPGRPANTGDESAQVSDRGKTRDKVAAAIGMAGSTYDKAKVVVAAAEADEPGGIQALATMEETGRVTTAYRELRPDPYDHKHRDGLPLSKKAQIDATAAGRRISKVCSSLDGWAMGLADFDVSRALQTAEPVQVEEWINSISQGISALRQLRTDLQGGS